MVAVAQGQIAVPVTFFVGYHKGGSLTHVHSWARRALEADESGEIAAEDL
jgi:hypothetical protein